MKMKTKADQQHKIKEFIFSQKFTESTETRNENETLAWTETKSRKKRNNSKILWKKKKQNYLNRNPCKTYQWIVVVEDAKIVKPGLFIAFNIYENRNAWDFCLDSLYMYFVTQNDK